MTLECVPKIETSKKTLTIEPDVAQGLKSWRKEGHVFQLQHFPCPWSTPAFGLVQTKTPENKKLIVTDLESGIDLYYTEEQKGLFVDLEIIQSKARENLLIVRQKQRKR